MNTYRQWVPRVRGRVGRITRDVEPMGILKTTGS